MTCEFPANTVLVSYRRGCRCGRCRAGHAEKHREYSQRYVERNRERRLASVRAWQERNADKHRANRRNDQARRRARIRGCEVSERDRDLVARIYALCPAGYEVDHIVPLSKGGAHSPGNLQYMKAAENWRKSSRTTWIAKNGTVIPWRSIVKR